MQFKSPISSHLGKFIIIKDLSNNNIEIQTPQLVIYKILNNTIIVETDESIKNWLSEFYKSCTSYFKHYLPRNKQSSSFDGESSYLTIKLKDDTQFFRKKKDSNIILLHSLSEIYEGDSITLLIETPGIWVNKDFYGTTWSAKQILST